MEKSAESHLLLLLPGDPGFNEILATPPPDPGRQYAYVVRAGQQAAEYVSAEDLQDYLEGGEYDQRLSEIDAQAQEVEINQDLTSDVLYLPCSVTL